MYKCFSASLWGALGFTLSLLSHHPALASPDPTVVMAQADGKTAALAVKPEPLSARVRNLAARLEAQAPDAYRGLLERVESRLVARVVLPFTNDWRQDLAQSLPIETLGRDITVSPLPRFSTGFVLFDSQEALEARYRRLEALPAREAADVERRLDMRVLALKLEWLDEAKHCRDRAVQAARAYLQQQPHSAEAHYLLAAALGWQDGSGPETQALISRALQIEPEHMLAQLLVLDRKLQMHTETFAFRRRVTMDESVVLDAALIRQIYDFPLSDGDRATYHRLWKQLEQELAGWLERAAKRGQSYAYLRGLAWWCSTLQKNIQRFELAASSPRISSADEFARRANQVDWIGGMKESSLWLRAIELSRRQNDPMSVGALAIYYGLRSQAASHATGMPMLLQDLKVLQDVSESLRRNLAPASTLTLSTRLETAEMLLTLHLLFGLPPLPMDDFFTVMLLEPPQPHVTETLCVAMQNWGSEPEVSLALVEIWAAVSPSARVRRLHVAAAAKRSDWETAFRQLNALDQTHPGDLVTLRQRVETLLRRGQSRETLDTVARLYISFSPATVLASTASLAPKERRLFLYAYIAYLLISGDGGAADNLLRETADAGLIDGTQLDTLRLYLPRKS
jgi:hypothetical protein